MPGDPRYPRSREANWEGIPIWALIVALVVMADGCGRSLEYRPGQWPSWWSLQLGAFLSLVGMLALKLHLTRHRLTLLMTLLAPPALIVLVEWPSGVRDRAMAAKIAADPNALHQVDNLTYYPDYEWVHVEHAWD